MSAMPNDISPLLLLPDVEDELEEGSCPHLNY
jgi:hypothetical protein